jgi:hypothetical protein
VEPPVQRVDLISAHLIAGRVLAEDGLQRSVAFIRSLDEHSRTASWGQRRGLMFRIAWNSAPVLIVIKDIPVCLS